MTAVTELALNFAQALCKRDYAGAHALCCATAALTPSQLEEQFEEIVPLDWVFYGSPTVEQTLDDWPAKEASDTGWAYVSIGGDMYSEGITVIVSEQGGKSGIRSIEFGRP